MKTYEFLFGIYTIRVKASNEKEAEREMLKKFNGYKDGGDKKEYIRKSIESGEWRKYLPPLEVRYNKKIRQWIGVKEEV